MCRLFVWSLVRRWQFVFDDSDRSSIRHSPCPGTIADEGENCYDLVWNLLVGVAFCKQESLPNERILPR